MARAASAVMVVLLGRGVAAAQEAKTEPAANERSTATISVSPVHLYYRMVEAEAELKAAPHVGLGLILGGGRASDPNETVTGTAYEAGLQINWYALAPFRGLHLGVESISLKISDVMDDPFAHASGFSVGSYVGYKLQSEEGLSLIAQAGVQYIAATGASSTQMIDDHVVAPLLNLNVGWSF
jgi:hypothetical protein